MSQPSRISKATKKAERVLKGIGYFIVFGIPFVINGIFNMNMSTTLCLALGAVIVMLLDPVKH